MKYTITKKITSFDQIDWINVQNLIGGKVTQLNCEYNQITTFQHLPTSVTELNCNYNQITSFQHLSNSVTILICNYNQINSFQHLPNSITLLYCKYNQITNFKHLPNSINELYCYNNSINSHKYILYKPLYFTCNVIITNDDINNNRFIYGLTKVNNIFKNKQATRIQKICQKYWYNDLLDVESTQMCRFGYYSWKQM